jgi:hypothetical protein
MKRSFKHRKTGYIATQLENERTDLYKYECGDMKHVILLSLLEDSCDWEEIIESVKRLSDGEIFSIGDKITFKGLFGNNSEHKYDIIKGFKFKQDKKIGALYHNGIVGLEIIEKYKEPIFTTEDGVDLFGGESVYGVTDSFQLAYTSILTEENGQRCRLFAEKEKAEKYIEENKPQYSQKDVENAMGGDFFCKSVEGLLIKNVVLELLKIKISEPLQAL